MRALTLLPRKIVPSPVMALRQTIGRPIAASDPTTAAWTRDMMREIGLELAVERANLAHDHARRSRGIKAAAAPDERMQMKTFRLDGAPMTVDAGGDVHLEARIARGARHRQAMRDEVPVFGHQIDRRGVASAFRSAARARRVIAAAAPPVPPTAPTI